MPFITHVLRLQGDNFQLNVVDNLSNDTMLTATTIVSNFILSLVYCADAFLR